MREGKTRERERERERERVCVSKNNNEKEKRKYTVVSNVACAKKEAVEEETDQGRDDVHHFFQQTTQKPQFRLHLQARFCDIRWQSECLGKNGANRGGSKT